VLDAAGEIVREGALSNTRPALARLLADFPRATVAMEAGTHSPWISRFLTGLGAKVIVANPRKLHAISRNERKCDQRDAQMLARLARVDPVRRRVALKVIKLGMDTKNVIARFEAERQALALMDHPNIAKVFDAGATKTGRPFFVMELVRGTKVTEFCDTNKVSTNDRLKLFIQVCQAIQHAHQNGIIHRDIKPSNILVTMRDGVPVPKVIVRHDQTPARRLQLPESECSGAPDGLCRPRSTVDSGEAACHTVLPNQSWVVRENTP
jgi:serine/threonine protein kinase